jgi:hypothetical protein
MDTDLHATFLEHADWIAKKLRQPQADWFVFPFSTRVRPIDPTRPVTTLKSAWEAVRDAAGVECRFHDLRHSAYTRLVEAGAPEGVIEALFGHVSKEMRDRYSHVRMAAMRKAVENLKLPELTKEVAKVSENSKTPGVTEIPKVLKKKDLSGGPDRTRICDLLRVKQAL